MKWPERNCPVSFIATTREAQNSLCLSSPDQLTDESALANPRRGADERRVASRSPADQDLLERAKLSLTADQFNWIGERVCTAEAGPDPRLVAIACGNLTMHRDCFF